MFTIDIAAAIANYTVTYTANFIAIYTADKNARTADLNYWY